MTKTNSVLVLGGGRIGSAMAMADLTVLRVAVEGTRGDDRVGYAWDLLDRYDEESGLRSMSRTTAIPATIVAGKVGRGTHATVDERAGAAAAEGVLAAS
jgi:hypothetical protein